MLSRKYLILARSLRIWLGRQPLKESDKSVLEIFKKGVYDRHSIVSAATQVRFLPQIFRNRSLGAEARRVSDNATKHMQHHGLDHFWSPFLASAARVCECHDDGGFVNGAKHSHILCKYVCWLGRFSFFPCFILVLLLPFWSLLLLASRALSCVVRWERRDIHSQELCREQRDVELLFCAHHLAFFVFPTSNIHRWNSVEIQGRLLWMIACNFQCNLSVNVC